LPHVVGGEIGEEEPLHASEVCVTNVTFATSHMRTTGLGAAPTVRS
jgi:hypothetical protein